MTALGAWRWRKRQRGKKKKMKMPPLPSFPHLPRDARIAPVFVPRSPPGTVPVGHVRYPSFRPSVSPTRLVTARIPTASSVLLAVVAEMKQQGVVRSLTRPCRVNITPFVIDKGGKGVMIADCRHVNALDDVRPPKRAWPAPMDCVKMVTPGDWMATVDVARCYDSLVLPSELTRRFRFALRDSNGRYAYYAFERLPFGWHWSPALAQEIVEGCVRGAVKASSPAVRSIVYIDDVLVIGPSPASVAKSVRAVCSRLSDIGFLISPKSNLQPSQVVEFLGLRLDASSDRVEGCAAMAIPSVPDLHRMFFSDPRRAVGLINWIFPHHLPLVAPIVHAIESGLRPSWAAAGSVAALVPRQATVLCRGEDDFASSCSRPVSVHRRFVVYCDAAAAHRLAAAVCSDGRTRVWSIPAWLWDEDEEAMRQQQRAELYALVRAYRWAAASAGSRAIVVSDNVSALFAVRGMRAPSADVRRNVLLRSVLLNVPRCDRPSLAFLKSELMPADTLSRGGSRNDAVEACRAVTHVFPLPGTRCTRVMRPRGLIGTDKAVRFKF